MQECSASRVNSYIMYTYHTASTVWVGMFEGRAFPAVVLKVLGSSKLLLKSAPHSPVCSLANTRCPCAAEPGTEFQPSEMSCRAGTFPLAPLQLDKLPQWFSVLQILKLFNFKMFQIPFPIMKESTIKFYCLHNYEAVKTHMHSVPSKYYESFKDTTYYLTFSILLVLNFSFFLFFIVFILMPPHFYHSFYLEH